MTDIDVLIIGAGVSGLSVAKHLPKTTSYLVIEADREIGGYCKTIQQDGFTWDYSGHFFHFKHEDLEAELVSKMGNQRILRIQKESGIHWINPKKKINSTHKNLRIDFPFQKNIHQLPKQEFVDCLVDLHFRAQLFNGKESRNFKEMLYEKFGASIAEKFLIPYNEKLYATDLNRLDKDAMGRFFPYADEDDIIRNMKAANNHSYNSTFTYPEGGAIQYVHAIMQDVKPDAVSLNERVLRIDASKRVATTNQRTIAYKHLVNTVPFPALLNMLGESVSEDYTWNQVLVFNLGFDGKGPEQKLHWLYVPQKDVVFYRVGFYDNIFGADRTSLYVEIGYPKDVTITESMIAEARERTLKDLKIIGVITTQKLLSHHHVVMNPAYVHITQSSVEAVAKKKTELESHGIRSIGRYGSWTYCSIEDNMVEAKNTANDIAKMP